MLYESLAVPESVGPGARHPDAALGLRLLGARVGKKVWLNTTDLTEFDCVSIGDEAELNAWCGPQTHLFEDRVMKIGRVEIGAGVTVGTRTTILYDTQVGAGRGGPVDAGSQGGAPAGRHGMGRFARRAGAAR